MVAVVLGAGGPALADGAPAPDPRALAARRAQIDAARDRVLTSAYQRELPTDGADADGRGSGSAAARPRTRIDPRERSIDTRERRAEDTGPLGSLMTFLLWGVVIVMAVLIAFWFASELLKGDDNVELAPADAEAAAAAETAAIIARPLGDADELARRGEFAEAIHTLLLRTLAGAGAQRRRPRRALSHQPRDPRPRAAARRRARGVRRADHRRRADALRRRAGERRRLRPLPPAVPSLRHRVPGHRDGRGASRRPGGSGMSGPFTRTTLWVVVGVAAVSLAAAAVLTILGDDIGGGTPSAGADSYSRSAIGHRGLVELLERLDVPVVRSRNASADKAQHGLLIVAEPQVSDAASRERLRTMVKTAPRTLIVLPKWYGRARPGEPWVEEVDFVPVGEIDDVLEVLQIEGGLVRTIALPGMEVPGTPLEVQGPLAGQPPPRLRAPQLLSTEQIDPIVVGDAGGIVLGFGTWKDTDHEVWVLADPDAINNHGLRTPENARFAVALIDQLRRGGPVVFDEVIHGYAQPPSLLRTLFRFPLVLATLQVLICALLAVWAAMVRFGPRRAAAAAARARQGLPDPEHGGAAPLRRSPRRRAPPLPRAERGRRAPRAARAGARARRRPPRGSSACGRRAAARSVARAGSSATPRPPTPRTASSRSQIACHRWRMEMTHGAHDRS